MDEEMMVLRLPPEVAADVRAKLRNKEDVSDLILSFIDTKQALGLGRQTTAYGRMADVFACGRQFQARLLDLPCMIEALKTRNNQDYVKVGNVGQMLCVTEIEHAHMLPEPSDDAAFISPHGLTSAAHNALRRFRGDRKEITEDDRANMKRVLEEVERVHNKSVGKGNDGDKDETFEELELDDEEIEAMKKDLQVGKDIPLDNNGKSPRKRKASTKLTVGGGKKRPAAASGESSLPASSPPAGAYDMTSEQLGSGISTASGASPNVSPSARFVLSPPLTTAASPPGYSSDGGASPAYSPGYNSDGGGVYSDDAGAANSDEDGAVLSEEEGEEHADAAAPNSTGPAQSPQAQAEDDDDDDGLAGFMEDLEDELGSDDGEEGGGVEGGPVEGQIPADEGSAVAALDDPRLFEIAERLEELKKSLEAQRNPAMRSRLQDQIDKLVAEEQEISGRGGDSDLGTQDGEVVEGGAIEGSEIIDDAVGAAVDEEDTLEQELMQEFGVGNDGSFGLDAFDESDGW